MADRAYVREALERRTFAIGEYQIGRITGKASINVGYPMLDPTEIVQAVIFAALDLAWFTQLAAAAQLSSGTALTVLDRQGTIVARYPDPERWVGQLLPQAALVHAIMTHPGEGTAEVAGLDDIPRLYAFTPLWGSPARDELTLSLGIPTAVAFSGVHHRLVRHLVGLGVVALLALAATQALGQRWILRPVQALVQATHRLGAGDLRARTGLPHTSGELYALAHGFDAMAASLEQLTQRHALILEAVGEGICGLDQQGQIIFANPAAARLSGYDRDELLGHALHTRLHHTYPDGTPYPWEACPTLATLRTGAVQERSEDVYWHKDGMPLPVEYVSSPLREGGTIVGAVVAFRDITERQRAVNALRRAKEAAEAANRAKSEFLANVSHEVRTPLNGVMASLDLLRDTALTPDQREYVTTAQDSAEGLLTLLTTVLDFATVEAGRRPLISRPFPLRHTLHSLLQPFAQQAHEKGLHLTWQVAPELPDVLVGDGDGLCQVVEQLVGNAIKFTARGEVAVHVAMAAQAAATITVHLAVRDTGSGIPAAKQQLIFELFTQADGSATRQHGGIGLGLTLARRLVELMGGQLWVQSTFGQGSTFHCTLPFQRPEDTDANQELPTSLDQPMA